MWRSICAPTGTCGGWTTGVRKCSDCPAAFAQPPPPQSFLFKWRSEFRVEMSTNNHCGSLPFPSRRTMRGERGGRRGSRHAIYLNIIFFVNNEEYTFTENYFLIRLLASQCNSRRSCYYFFLTIAICMNVPEVVVPDV